jgi:hypothetical protein
LASVVLAVFALYYLLGSATTSKYALLGMIAALLAIVLSYVLRLEPDGDDEPAA